MIASSTMGRSARYARVASLLVATLSACGRSDRQTTNEAGDSLATAAPPAASGADPMGGVIGTGATETMTESEMVRTLMAANMADSASGALAAQQARSAEVKAFGRDMVKDHGGLNERLNQMATTMGAAPSSGGTADSLQQQGMATLSHLRTLQGAAFDSAYVAHAEAEHAALLQMLNDRLLPQVQNGELRTLLTQARDEVASHLERVRTLRTTTPR